MNALLWLLWLAGLVQILNGASNLFLPRKLHYQENLGRVAPVIRQMAEFHGVLNAVGFGVCWLGGEF
jgi:hypothetical protein